MFYYYFFLFFLIQLNLLLFVFYFVQVVCVMDHSAERSVCERRRKGQQNSK